jgi:hypothetical protein
VVGNRLLQEGIMGGDLSLERAWRKRLRRYEGSGLTIREFCEQEGLVDHQFSWWRGELKRRAAESMTGNGEQTRKQPALAKKKTRHQPRGVASRFVAVELEPAMPTQASIEIILDQPPRIRLAAGCDAELLREVVRVLEQR